MTYSPPPRRVRLPIISSRKSAAGRRSPATLSNITNVVPFLFRFSELRSSGNPRPGRLLQQSRVINRPDNSGFIVALAAFSGSFVTNDGTYLTQRPLGEFLVEVGIQGFNELLCRVQLTDDNEDDSVKIEVAGNVLFFDTLTLQV